ncbi:hypothetical protein B0H10DRAFT_2235217 [Mycena sp. CBHHK59/15]|nr:hypothetical protein B0H10DRAFT_2235217 [Mycena sp. CBHHK59/15]
MSATGASEQQGTVKIRPNLVVGVHLDSETVDLAPFTTLTYKPEHPGWADISQGDISFERSTYIWIGAPANTPMIFKDEEQMHINLTARENGREFSATNLANYRRRRNAYWNDVVLEPLEEIKEAYQDRAEAPVALISEARIPNMPPSFANVSPQQSPANAHATIATPLGRKFIDLFYEAAYPIPVHRNMAQFQPQPSMQPQLTTQQFANQQAMQHQQALQYQQASLQQQALQQAWQQPAMQQQPADRGSRVY